MAKIDSYYGKKFLIQNIEGVLEVLTEPANEPMFIGIISGVETERNKLKARFHKDSEDNKGVNPFADTHFGDSQEKHHFASSTLSTSSKPPHFNGDTSLPHAEPALNGLLDTNLEGILFSRPVVMSGGGESGGLLDGLDHFDLLLDELEREMDSQAVDKDETPSELWEVLNVLETAAKASKNKPTNVSTLSATTSTNNTAAHAQLSSNFLSQFKLQRPPSSGNDEEGEDVVGSHLEREQKAKQILAEAFLRAHNTKAISPP
eukprot:gene26658-33272_t